MGNTCENEEQARSSSCLQTTENLEKSKVKESEVSVASEKTGDTKSPNSDSFKKGNRKQKMNPPSEKIFRIIRNEFRVPVVDRDFEKKYKKVPIVTPVEDEEGNTYKGQMVDGVKFGFGEIVYKTGEMYEGYWEDNQRSGRGRYFYLDGTVFDGLWSNGVYSGKGRFYFSRDEYYDGNFENGLKNGLGKMQFENGDYYEGNWKNGFKHGEGVYFTLKSRFFEFQTWKDGFMMK